MAARPSSFLFLDLFAGIGGFALALQRFGGQTSKAVEINKKAANVYSLNFGHEALGDVRKVAEFAKSMPHFQVLVGGFPCQPFSKSGAQLGTNEPRGNLFDSIAEIIEVQKPLVVVLENVRNLIGPKHRDEFDRITTKLRSLGYRVSSEPSELSPHQLPPEEGGSPQFRPRIFITATHAPDANGVNDDDPAPAITGWPEGEIDWQLRRDLPMEDGLVEGYEISVAEENWLTAWDGFLQLCQVNKINVPGFPLWTDFWTPLRSTSEAKMPEWKIKFVQKNRDFYLQHQLHFDAWLAQFDVRSFPPSKRKLEWQAGNLTTLWDGLIQFRPSGVRVKKPNYAPALVAMNQIPIFGPYRRRLTTLEAARLQGFPDEFIFQNVNIASTYSQLGNAVHVGVVERVFRAHLERDKDILGELSEGRAILSGVGLI